MGPAGGDAAPGAITDFISVPHKCASGPFLQNGYLVPNFRRKGVRINGDEKSPGKKSEKDHQKEIMMPNIGY